MELIGELSDAPVSSAMPWRWLSLRLRRMSLAAILAEDEDYERLFNLLMNDDVYDQYNSIHEHLPQLPGARPYVDKLLSRVRTRYARRSTLLYELSKV